jgi:hypothetical protein
VSQPRAIVEVLQVHRLGAGLCRCGLATTGPRRSRSPCVTGHRRTHGPPRAAFRVPAGPVASRSRWPRTGCRRRPARRHRVGAALGQRHHPGLREGRLLALVDTGPAEELRVPRRVGHIEAGPSTATSRRPANHTPGVASPPIGLATRSNNAANGSEPNSARAWKIADLLGSEYVSCHPEVHDSPSVNCASTSSYEPSARWPASAPACWSCRQPVAPATNKRTSARQPSSSGTADGRGQCRRGGVVATVAWPVVVSTAAIALRRAGAPWPTAAAVADSVLIAVHGGLPATIGFAARWRRLASAADTRPPACLCDRAMSPSPYRARRRR